MRNLARASNYYNRIEAEKDWLRIASEAEKLGLSCLAVKFAPPREAGHRTIDKRITLLRNALTDYIKQLREG